MLLLSCCFLNSELFFFHQDQVHIFHLDVTTTPLCLSSLTVYPLGVCFDSNIPPCSQSTLYLLVFVCVCLFFRLFRTLFWNWQRKHLQMWFVNCGILIWNVLLFRQMHQIFPCFSEWLPVQCDVDRLRFVHKIDQTLNRLLLCIWSDDTTRYFAPLPVWTASLTFEMRF